MDLFRARAIAALAAAALPALLAHGADCAALNGTYSAESAELHEGAPRTLDQLAPDRVRAQLYRQDKPAEAPKPPPGLDAGPLRSRPARATRLAATARLTHAGGTTKLRFHDAQGNSLAETPLATAPKAWRCVGGHLERSFDTLRGLGDAIRTDRTVQSLERTPEGDLLLAETVTTVKPATGKPARSEARFRRAAAAPAGK